MRCFERWFVRRLFKREVLQGYDHATRISGLYALVREACENEFYEDNAPTLSSFLSECFERTQQWPFGCPVHQNVIDLSIGRVLEVSEK